MSIIRITEPHAQPSHNSETLGMTASETLEHLWESRSTHLVVLEAPNEDAWVFCGNDKIRLASVGQNEWTLLKHQYRVALQTDKLLDRLQRQNKRLERAAGLGYTDESLCQLFDSEDPVRCDGEDLCGDFGLRASHLDPLFHLLPVLSRQVPERELLEKVERWKRTLGPQSPLWLHCHLLFASHHLHRLDGSMGKSDYEGDLLKSRLKGFGSDPTRGRWLDSETLLKPWLPQRKKVSHDRGDEKVLQLRCFGTPQVALAGSAVPRKVWRTQKALSLFFYLAMERRTLSSDRLQEVLWPGRGGDCAQNFSTTVSRVRKALATIGVDGSLVRSGGRLYGLRHDVHIQSDKEEFERRVRKSVDGEFDPAKAHSTLRLYRGAFLEGLNDLWVVQTRRRLQDLWFRLAQRLFEAELERGELQTANDLSQRMLRLDASREDSHLAQIETLFRMGRHNDAHEAYSNFSRIMRKSTGLTPSAGAEKAFRDMKQRAEASHRRLQLSD